MKLQVFSKDNCHHCVTAKNILKGNQIQFEELEFGKNADLNEFKESYPHVRSVPAFFVDGKYIGGSEKLDLIINMMENDNGDE